MTSLTIDPRSAIPPFEQIRSQLAELISAGALQPGDRLPPVRQLAADLGLAVGTANRAYRELEAAGLVVTRRRTGTHIAETARPRNAAESTRMLNEAALAYVRAARTLGATNDAMLAAVAEAATTAPTTTATAAQPEHTTE